MNNDFPPPRPTDGFNFNEILLRFYQIELYFFDFSSVNLRNIRSVLVLFVRVLSYYRPFSRIKRKKIERAKKLASDTVQLSGKNIQKRRRKKLSQRAFPRLLLSTEIKNKIPFNLFIVIWISGFSPNLP